MPLKPGSSDKAEPRGKAKLKKEAFGKEKKGTAYDGRGPKVKSQPGGEEGEELRAALPYKGAGTGYHDREGYEKGEYAKAGDWSTPGEGAGHRFSASKTRKLTAKAKKQKAKTVTGKISGMGSAEDASVQDLAKRAVDHGRGEEEFGGLKKGDPGYHQAAVASAKAGTHKSSVVAQTGEDTYAAISGRTSARHHQIAGKDVKASVISQADIDRAAKSATRHDAAEKSGKLAAIKKKLAAQGKTMRELSLHNSMEKRKPQSRVNAIPRGKVSSMSKSTLEEDRVIQGAPTGAFGLNFNNAWKLKSKDKSWLAGGMVKKQKANDNQIDELTLYDIAKMCTEPEGGYLDSDEMDKKVYCKAQRDAMRTEEVYGQGSLASHNVGAPSVDEDKEKLAKRKKRVHGKLHPHKKKAGGT